MNRKYNRAELEKKIIHLCQSPKSARELSATLDINLNTLRSKYIYRLYNDKRISRYLRKYKSINIE